MVEYIVKVPFAGSITVSVEAESEDEAIQAALETELCLKIEDSSTNSPEFCYYDLFEHICEGNVLYVEDCDVEIVEYPPEDEGDEEE